jgi:hypothetical protein
MVNQNLLTTFIAISAVAVVIQTGILVGFYVITAKLSRQANRAVSETQKLSGMLYNLAGTLQSASNRIAEYSSKVLETMRKRTV